MSLGGMVEAIDEVHRRGESMMGGIRKQRQMLNILQTEIKEAKGRITVLNEKLEGLSKRQSKAMDATANAQKNAARINQLKVRIDDSIKALEKQKEDSEDTLRVMETEIEELVDELQLRKPVLTRYKICAVWYL